MTLAVNARFLTQKTTGVQRFAAEVTRALAAHGAALRLLAPQGAPSRFDALPVEQVGRRTGQAWDQLDLPRAAGGDMLLNLGNTAPLLRGGNQALAAAALNAPPRAPHPYLAITAAWRG